jgi:hypothetical protein
MRSLIWTALIENGGRRFSFGGNALFILQII